MAALVDEHGRITVPGFYDDVLPLSERERKQFAALPFNEANSKSKLALRQLQAKRVTRRWSDGRRGPTFDINGLTSGYQGEGAKTILPAKASAKFSFRLVPNQDPKKIGKALEAYLRKLCPDGVTMELVDLSGAPGVVVPLESPYVSAASRAIEHGFGKAPVFIREGGSIPVVSDFHEKLGVRYSATRLGLGRR